MAVHMIRIAAEWPDGYTIDEINSGVDGWVADHTEWTADPTTHELHGRNTKLDGSGIEYVFGDYRFAYTDDKTTLLDDCEAELQQYCTWYRLGYHTCDHDESEQVGCSWDDEREYGTIPDGVVDFL